MYKVIASFLALSLLSGCSLTKSLKKEIYADYSVKSLEKPSNSEYKELINDFDTSKILEKKCFTMPISSTDETICVQQRNNSVAILGAMSERLCVEHRRSIYGNEAAWNITSGTFTNFFSGAAAVASSTSAKSLYAALALFSNSERSLVNETIYKSMLVHAVDTKLTDHRERLANEMLEKRNLSISEYSADQALHDLVKYHNSCSFMEGLRLALKEGTDERVVDKIARLKKNRKSISLQITSLRNQKTQDSNLVTDEDIKALLDRRNLIDDELETIEKE